jgi:hypothetical protein
MHLFRQFILRYLYFRHKFRMTSGVISRDRNVFCIGQCNAFIPYLFISSLRFIQVLLVLYHRRLKLPLNLSIYVYSNKHTLQKDSCKPMVTCVQNFSISLEHKSSWRVQNNHQCTFTNKVLYTLSHVLSLRYLLLSSIISSPESCITFSLFL